MGGSDFKDPAVYVRSQGRGLDAIGHGECRRFADYWCALRQNGAQNSAQEGRLMPRRQDIDPADIPWALSRLYMGDYQPRSENQPGTFRYRLAGDDIEAVFRHNTGRHSMKGVTLDDMLPPEGAALVAKRWRPLAEFGDIIFMSGLIYLAAERIGLGARLILPLSDSGDHRVTGFLGFTDCDWLAASERAGQDRLEVCYIPLAETA